MRKKITVLIAVIFAFTLPTVNTQDNIKIFVNEEELYTDVAPVVIEGRTLVPLRAITEALNCEVSWDEYTQTATISNTMDIMNVTINSYWIKKSSRDGDRNREIELDVPPMIIDGRTLVPARAIAESLNAVVDWYAPTNTVYITMEYDWIGDFYNGIAVVKKGSQYGYINEKRINVVPVIYDDVYSGSGYLSERNRELAAEAGLLWVEKDGKPSYVDKTGHLIVPFIYDYLEFFPIGFFIARKDGKYGYLDKKGNVILPAEYDYILGYEDLGIHPKQRYDYEKVFQEGLIKVGKDKKYGFVNLDNTIIVPIIYDSIDSDFNEYNLAEVKKDGKYGYIDKSGKIIIPTIYSFEFAWDDGMICVNKGGKYGFVDDKGNIIVPVIYDRLHAFNEEGLSLAIKDGKYGLVDKKGKIVAPVIYDSIRHFYDEVYNVSYFNESGLAEVEKDDVRFHIDKNGNRVD